MRFLAVAACLAVVPLGAQAATSAVPAWSFEAPLGGFDLGAAQRGFGLYEQRCASCHAMAALGPADLLRLGFDRHAATGVLRGLGHPPFTAGTAADLSRFERVAGAGATWRLLLEPDAAPAYNALPQGHPRLSSASEASDLVTFLAWAANPHQTVRRQVGVGALLFGLLAIGCGWAATRRSRHG